MMNTGASAPKRGAIGVVLVLFRVLLAGADSICCEVCAASFFGCFFMSRVCKEILPLRLSPLFLQYSNKLS